MLREETAKLLMMIQGAYPNYKPDNKTVTINTWNLALSDISFDLAQKAFLAYLRADTKGFAPTPGQLIALVRELNTPKQLNELEAWSLVEKAIRNSIYNSQEEFSKLPPLVQKAVGSPNVLRLWAADGSYSEQVASSNFMRSYRNEAKKQEEYEKLPADMQQMIDQTNRNSYSAQIREKNRDAIQIMTTTENAEIEASLRRMAQKVNDIGATAKAALNKQIDAFARLNSQYDSQSEKIDALKRKIAGYSDEYGEMQAKIDETVKKLNDLEMMQGVIKDAVKDSAKRGTTFDTTQYKWVQEDIEKLTKEIEVAEREQDKLFATGNPFELGSKARAAKEDLEKLSQEEGKLADMHNKLQTAYDGVNDKINEYSQKADEATASTSRLSRIGGMVGKAIGSIATFGKNAAKSLTGAKKSSSGFGLSLGTLVKYGFGIRSLYVLVNKLRSALVDGFKNLSQYSGETNGSISMLWSSLERLKNSLATAFAPILTVVAPILSKFIDMLSTAASYVSMFFSFLSGKSTYTRAMH